MPIEHLLSSNAVKAGVSTGAVAAVQEAASGTIQVAPSIYTLIAVALGLVGVYLARLVTIDAENKKLGRIQTLRETGPLTWIGVLIVCPFIWHFNIAIPWASMIGLGVGYSVRMVLKVFGGGAIGAARALAKRAAETLEEEQNQPRPGTGVLPPTSPTPPDQVALLEALKDVPPVLPPADET